MLKYLIFTLTLKLISTELHEINLMNVADTLKKKDVLVINFYAKWCRFSQILEPIFKELDSKIQQNGAKDNVALARIDGTANPQLLVKYGVNYFPAIIVFRNGEKSKKEYQGPRDLDSLYKFVLSVSHTKPIVITNLNEIDKNNLNIYMKVASKNNPEYLLFEKVASKYLDDANFYVMLVLGPSEITFITSQPYDKVETLGADQMMSETLLNSWIIRKCHPLVREITFENADSIIADHKPILLLFYRLADKSLIPMYVNKLEKLNEHFGEFSMVVANAEKFKHALSHIKRSVEDAPFVALDDFKHIYYFGKFEDLNNATKVKQFVNEFNSGELHKRLHQEMQIEIIIIRMDNEKQLPINNKEVKVNNKEAPPPVAGAPPPALIGGSKGSAPSGPYAGKKPYFVKSLFQKLLPDNNSFSHLNDIHEL